MTNLHDPTLKMVLTSNQQQVPYKNALQLHINTRHLAFLHGLKKKKHNAPCTSVAQGSSAVEGSSLSDPQPAIKMEKQMEGSLSVTHKQVNSHDEDFKGPITYEQKIEEREQRIIGFETKPKPDPDHDDTGITAFTNVPSFPLSNTHLGRATTAKSRPTASSVPVTGAHPMTPTSADEFASSGWSDVPRSPRARITTLPLHVTRSIPSPSSPSGSSIVELARPPKRRRDANTTSREGSDSLGDDNEPKPKTRKGKGRERVVARPADQQASGSHVIDVDIITDEEDDANEEGSNGIFTELYPEIRAWSLMLNKIRKARTAEPAFEIFGDEPSNLPTLLEVIKEIDEKKYWMTKDEVVQSKLARRLRKVLHTCDLQEEAGIIEIIEVLLDNFGQRFINRRRPGNFVVIQ